MRRIVKTNLVALFVLSQSCLAYVSPAKKTTVDKEKKVIIAVIDTGLDPSLMTKSWVCKRGHKDFTGLGLKDNHGHGTHISGLVDQYAKDFIIRPFTLNKSKIDEMSIDYCQIVLKYYDPKARGSNNLVNTIKAFEWAIEQGVDIINYSGGGTDFSVEERRAVLKALNKGIKVVAAAGNEKSDIDRHRYYPAMYDKRTYIVGNLVDAHSRRPAVTSNYGKSVNTWETGTDVYSRLPHNTFGFMTGTSQAAAIKSGKLVREMLLAK